MSKPKPSLKRPTSAATAAERLADNLADRPYKAARDAPSADNQAASMPADNLNLSQRRGRNYKDPATGISYPTGGAVLQVPVNAGEWAELKGAAAAEGLSVAAFIRSAALKSARHE